MSDLGSLSGMGDRVAGFIDHPILQVQPQARAWRREAYPETRGYELQALGVAEEAGELCHAVLKFKQGIRGYDYMKTKEEIEDAIGDIYIYASGVADEFGINMVEAIVKAWEYVKNRNITQGSDPGSGQFPGYNNEGKWVES